MSSRSKATDDEGVEQQVEQEQSNNLNKSGAIGPTIVGYIEQEERKKKSSRSRETSQAGAKKQVKQEQRNKSSKNEAISQVREAEHVQQDGCRVSLIP
ncbi:unnamed protein product [Sphagnum jensenii]|uniref:Uncharacterized protein n=1 Tax=Sphagnum jensenii TaxID=128206 RepID=A0ABP1C308_9BRYO